MYHYLDLCLLSDYGDGNHAQLFLKVLQNHMVIINVSARLIYHKSIHQNNITTNKTLSIAQVQAASHIYCGKNSCCCGCCLRLNSSVDRPILSWGSAVFEYRPPCSLYRFYGTLLSTSNPTFCSCVSRAPPVSPSGQSATLKQPASRWIRSGDYCQTNYGKT